MRIGLALDDSLDVLDGVQQYVVTLGAELARRGHEVSYLVGQTSNPPVAGVHSFGRIARIRIGRNLVRTPLPTSAAEVRRGLEGLPLDVLHVQAPYGPLLVGKLMSAMPPATRVVATWHTVRGSAAVGLLARFLRVALRRTLRRIDHSIAVSPATRSFVAGYYGQDAEVLGCPIDVAAFAGAEPAPKPAGTRRIVFLGRLVPHKGPDVLLEALALAAERLPRGTEAVFVGDGAMREALEGRARDLPMPVHFLGAIYGSEKVAHLASADVAVFPSTAESFGIVLLEAMAAGAGVVLGADNEGYRFVLDSDADALFGVGDAAALAERLVAVVGDETLARAIHERQARRVAAFDVRRVVDRLEEIYSG